MKNYNEIVSKARECARDLLRMMKINDVRQDLMHDRAASNGIIKGYEKQKAYWKSEVEKGEKRLAVMQYDLSKLDPAHPCHEEQKEEMTKGIEDEKKNLDDLKKTDPTVDCDQKIAKTEKNWNKIEKNYNEEIESISRGEVKVSASELKQETIKILQEITHTAATEACDYSSCSNCEAGDMGTEVDETEDEDEDVSF